MTSSFPSDSTNSRTWWSLAPKQPNQDLRRSYSSDKSSRPSGFNSIAAALGFKLKKHPALAIQDPPSQPSRSPVPTPATIDTNFTNRPPSKSVSSSSRSRADSLGPTTPLDAPRHGRQSLLTLSDTDPFAVRAPHTPSEPNRLSVYSNSSIPDFISKPADPIFNRASYASSSSHSNFYGSELSPLSQSTQDVPDNISPKKPKLRKSMGSLHRKQSLAAIDQSLGSAWETLTLANRSIMSKSNSSATLTDKNRFSQPDVVPISRPPMRARGMTDSDTILRSNFLSSEGSISAAHHISISSHTPPTSSPRVIIRQPSVSRIGLPPSAPPRHELPPPPPPTIDHRVKADDPELVVPLSTGSASSSTLSFASSVSSHREVRYSQTYSPRQKERKPLERSISSKVETDGSRNASSAAPQPSPTSRNLKKALSHQSLGRRAQSSNSPSPTSPPEPPIPAKAPRKQRSFHQPKVRVPTMPPPLRPTTTGSQPHIPPTEPQPVSEQRRGSAGVIFLPGRKRLFSGSSRRPSTSQCIFPDDDSRSIFSIRSDPDKSAGTSLFKPIGPPLSPTASSFWDEPSYEQVPPSPRPVGHEYTPQQIMSPAEMAKLEASVEETSTYGRQRGLSILSASTTIISDGEDESISADGPSPILITSTNGTANGPMARSNSLMHRGLTVPPRPSIRPSTSQGSMTVHSPLSSTPNSTPTTPSITSLPPPPRRSRPRPTFILDEPPGITPLPPPPGRKYVRPRISVEKTLHRQSIMRKPSFLDIDDDTDDKDTDEESPVDPLSGSFLDLARESFDTVSSISE